MRVILESEPGGFRQPCDHAIGATNCTACPCGNRIHVVEDLTCRCGRVAVDGEGRLVVEP